MPYEQVMAAFEPALLQKVTATTSQRSQLIQRLLCLARLSKHDLIAHQGELFRKWIDTNMFQYHGF